jgi:hypothetical protein
MSEQIFEMDLGPAVIYIDNNNYFFNQGEVRWNNRYFYFRCKYSYAEFVEYPSDDWVENPEIKEIKRWGMDYPQEVITHHEIYKLFWHLVASEDPERLDSCRKWAAENLKPLIKGGQK